MKCISYVNSCVPYWFTQGERGLSLSGSITVRNGDGPTGTDSVKEDIRDWQSVSWESGKRRMTFLWREVSAHGGAEKATVSPPLRWLLLSCTRKLSAIFQEDSPSFNLPLSFYLSATSPPPNSTPLCMQCHPTSPLPPLPSLCLCQPLLNQIDCRCVTSLREDSLRLCACEPSLWHSASSNLPCRNLSTEPKTYINTVYTCRALWSSDLS